MPKFLWQTWSHLLAVIGSPVYFLPSQALSLLKISQDAWYFLICDCWHYYWLLILLIFGYESKYVLLAGLGMFFIAFNVMEALLPSWLSKVAPIQSKATVMGINASSQFFGAFLGYFGRTALMLQNTALGGIGIAILWLLSEFWLGSTKIFVFNCVAFTPNGTNG